MFSKTLSSKYRFSHLRPCRVLGCDVEDDSGVGADLDLHGVLGRQVDLHVNIAEVDECEDLAAVTQDLTFLSQTIQDASLNGGVEGHVGNPRPDMGYFGLGRVDGLSGRVQPGLFAVQRSA
jgi:hypothetical protein